MIHLRKTPEFPDVEVLLASGGFAWWYLDAMNEAGDGLVVIWSYGLPFLPGHAAACKAGTGCVPTQRPSLNLVVYRGGQEHFYLLQEHPAVEQLPQEGQTERLGGSTLRTTSVEGQREMELHLDAQVPGDPRPLRGTVRLRGPEIQIPAIPGPNTTHLWTPLSTACTAQVDLWLGDEPLLRGELRAYHDRNESARPLQALGIDRWIWGRVALPDEERIFYALWPQSGGAPQVIALSVNHKGQVHSLNTPSVRVSGERRTVYGMTRCTELMILDGEAEWLRLHELQILDSGPFYLRYRVLATAPTGPGYGFAEAVQPERVDMAWQRPMVQTRVHRVAGGNSLLLPFMAGGREGRLGRFFRALGGGI